MAVYEVATTNAYTKLICTTATSIVGFYPNIAMRIRYGFHIKLTAYGSWYYNSFKFNFHGINHYINLNISFGAGGGTTGELAAGIQDFPWGSSPTQSHAPGFSCAGAFSGNGAVFETLSIPYPTNFHVYSITNITPFTAKVYHSLNPNTYGYWYVKLYDEKSKREWNANNNTGDGTTTLTDLTPETTYDMIVRLYNRNNTVQLIGAGTRFKTLADQFKTKIKLNGVLKTIRLYQNVNKIFKKAKKAGMKKDGAIKTFKNL